MKKLIPYLLLIFIAFGCSPKENELESIEIMTYYYVPNKDQNKLIIDYNDYSKIDANGNVETIKQVKPFESKYVYVKSKIDSEIISMIGESNKSKNDKYYETKIDTNSLEIYDGPIIRVRTKFKNNKVITFTYEKIEKYENDLKYSLFIKIQKAISNNYNKKYYEIIDSINIKKSQKEFEKFALSKDTLYLPMPPLPIDPSEQIKFPPPNK